MATYLVQVVIADLDFVESTGPDGLPIRHAFDADVGGPRRGPDGRDGGDDRRLRRPVRAVPVRRLRRRRGRRAAGLRPRDPDPVDLRHRRGHQRVGHRPRAGAPVVRRRRQPGHLAGHLAQRGLRHLRRAAVAGAPGRRWPRRVRRRVPVRVVAARPAARRPGARPAVRADRLRPRGADALRARPDGGTRHLPRHPAGAGSSATTTRSASTADFEALAEERVGAATSPRCSTPGCGRPRCPSSTTGSPDPHRRPAPSPSSRPPGSVRPACRFAGLPAPVRPSPSSGHPSHAHPDRQRVPARQRPR